MANNLTFNRISPRLANFRSAHPTLWKLGKSAAASVAILTAGRLISDGTNHLEPGLVPSLAIGTAFGFTKSLSRSLPPALITTFCFGPLAFPIAFPGFSLLLGLKGLLKARPAGVNSVV